jgi:hypothetical protein
VVLPRRAPCLPACARQHERVERSAQTRLGEQLEGELGCRQLGQLGLDLLVQAASTVVVEIETVPPVDSAHVPPARGEAFEQALDDVAIPRRIDARDRHQQPVGRLGRRHRIARRRQMDQHQQMQQGLGVTALRGSLEQLVEVRAIPWQQLARDRQELGLDGEDILEVADDRIGCDERSPLLVEERGDVSRRITGQLTRDEVDDAARLREPIADFLEQLERGGVDRVDRAQRAEVDRGAGKRFAHATRDVLYAFSVARALDQDAVGDQVADVHRAEPQHERKAILDLAIVRMVEVPDLLDRLLHRGDHEQAMLLAQLPEELEEADILGELAPIGLRAQELRQLVDHEQQPARMASHALRPADPPVVGADLDLERMRHRVLEPCGRGVVQHREHAAVGRASERRAAGQLLGQVREEV